MFITLYSITTNNDKEKIQKKGKEGIKEERRKKESKKERKRMEKGKEGEC